MAHRQIERTDDISVEGNYKIIKKVRHFGRHKLGADVYVDYNPSQQRESKKIEIVYQCLKLAITKSNKNKVLKVDAEINMNKVRSNIDINNWLLRQLHVERCAPFHIPEVFGWANPMKEITESSVFIKHLFDYVPDIKSRDDAVILVPGDGASPRCGFPLSLLLPNSKVFSIDPMLKVSDDNHFVWENKPNFLAIKSRIEDFEIPHNKEGSLTVILSIHAHIDMNKLWKRISGWKIAFVSPCCMIKKQLLPIDTVKSWREHEMASEKNRMFLYEEK